MSFTLYMFAMGICMGGAAWCILAWSVKDGQFKNMNESNNFVLEAEEKYR